MPSQKELRWSQLKVGILAIAALTTLCVLIFILAASSGGLFARKINLRSYFENANGLKVGATVTLEGVTIGNVTHVHILAGHEPNAVEVICRVGANYLPSLHTDSTVTINQAGVLGDAFLDISSVHATGPQPANNAELPVSMTPGLQDVIRTSQDSIVNINKVVSKVGILLDTINNGNGTAAMLLRDPTVAKKIARTVDQLQTLSENIASGKGSIGKLINDDELYNKANATVDKLNNIVAELDAGHGTAGKLLKDDSLYKNLNTTLTNANELLSGINSGKGSLGKLAKDPALANKVEETVTHLNAILKGIQEGNGTLGQLAANRSLYDNLDKTLNDTGQLISAIRKDPKTYLTVRVKVF
jgi:phospholipid/cholesterol/gamma-HCH transport system substrate-binding protein